MAPALPRAEDIFSSAKIDFSSQGLLTPVAEEVCRYEKAMRAEIDPLFSDNANQKTEHVINTVTALYDDLFDFAKSRGANNDVLDAINSFIEVGMTTLVHDFSGYFDDEVKELRAFISLLNTRRNEAIWCEVFTFYFNFSNLSDAPPSLASNFISRFWDCYLLADASRLGRPGPYYTARLSKIFFERIHDEPEYIKLFERYSRAIAEKTSNEKREAITRHLSILKARVR